MSEGGAPLYTERFIDDPANVVNLIKTHPAYYGGAIGNPSVNHDLGFEQHPGETTYVELRAGLQEILFRLRLFPEAGKVPSLNVDALSESDVQKYILQYGERLLNILGPRHLRQLERENEAIDNGITRYRKRVDKQIKSGLASESLAGENTIDRFVKLVAVLNEDFLGKALTGKAGPNHIAAHILRFIEPEVAAYITVKLSFDTAMHCEPEKRRWTALFKTIGDAILSEIQLKRAIYGNNPYYKKLMKSYHELEMRKDKRSREKKDKILSRLTAYREAIKSTCQDRGISMLHEAADIAASCGWEMRDAVGIRLLEHLETAAAIEQKKYAREVPAFRGEQIFQSPGVLPKVIVAAPWLIEEFDYRHTLVHDRHPLIRPMLTFPAPWTTATAYTGILPGGYRGSMRNMERQQRLVKSEDSEQIDSLSLVMHRKDNAVFRVLHGLQNSAFRINKRVFSVMERLKDTDIPAPIAPKDRGGFERKDKEDKAKIYSKWFLEEYPKRSAFMNTLAEAEDNLNEPTIFFPHTFDYRGRIYPRAAYINPQGNDISRGLLEFAEGGIINTKEAAEALAIHGANCYGRGIDKLSLPERIKWVLEHDTQISMIADTENPEGLDLWNNAEDKWQFLAFCFDWTDYMRTPVGEHISHLPVYVDGTCNGYQHMAALMRSKETGKLVGMVPWKANEQQLDIYEAALSAVEKYVDDNAGAGDSYAQYILRVINAAKDGESWLKFGRDLAKVPVMTYAYGATQKGISEAFQEKIRDKWNDSKISKVQWEILSEKIPYYRKKDKEWVEANGIWLFSFYLAGLFIKAINREMTGASHARKQLAIIGKRLAGVGPGFTPQAIKYTSPAGFPVILAEYETIEDNKEVEIMGKKIRFDLNIPKIAEGKPLLAPSKTAQGFPPHVVHSLDSSHLIFTIDCCLSEGMRSFVTTHDCYGCLASDMPRMNAILRDAFIEMYRDLDMQSLAVRLAEENRLDPHAFNDISVQGDLDLAFIRESPSFFS